MVGDTTKGKLFTQRILAQREMPVAKTILVKFPVNVELIEQQVGFPAVEKTLSGSQGKGGFLAQDPKSFRGVMQLSEVTNPRVNIIIQEFIADSYGRDLRVFVIGGRAVASMERYTDGSVTHHAGER